MSQRWLGLDFGLARIGVAVSDPTGSFALPVKVVKTAGSLKETALFLHKELASYHQVKGIVVGLPLLLSGKESPMSTTIREFGKHLEEVFGLPIIFWDERLSSLQADRLLQDRGMRRKERAQVVDSLAATTILQSYLDSLKLRRV